MKNSVKFPALFILSFLFGAVSFGQLTGYSFVCNENNSQKFSVPTDVAYGADGKFNFKYNITGHIEFSNRQFGDPAPGILKKGYAKPFLYGGKEGEVQKFMTPVVAAYGVDGRYVYKTCVYGKVTFSNNFFGSDPAPNVAKFGYYKPFEQVATEGKSYYINGRADVAYGANGQYIIKRNVTGWVKFDNVSFGSDPAPNVPKNGYINHL